jgi:hypothetical protein
MFEKLTSAQASAWDAYWPDVIDGAGGGTWAPSTVITIGGSGLNVTGPTNLTGDVGIGDNAGSQLTIYADTFVNRDIAFIAGKDATFNGNLIVAGAGQIDVNSGSFTASATLVTFGVQSNFYNNVSFAAGFTVTCESALVCTAGINVDASSIILTGGSLDCNVPASFSDSVNCSGTTTFTSAGTVTLDCPVGLTGILTPSGVGRVRRRVTPTADANGTYGAADGQVFRVPAFAANRTYVLTATGAGEGDWCHFSAYTLNGGFDLTINDDGASPMVVMENTVGGIVFTEFVFTSSAWRRTYTILQT